ncbi:MAG: hypothetical protein AAF399_26415, partial [Bacteroidota bacterium]
PCLAQQRPSSLRFNFQRQNNFTYATNVDTWYVLSKKKYRLELDVHHDNLFNSLIKDRPFVQSYIRAHVWQYFRLKDNLQLTNWIETDQFFNSGNLRYSLYMGGEYQWKDLIRVRPMIGYSWDRRSGILDQGFSPAIFAEGRYRLEDGWEMQSRVFARAKFIAPRHQRNVILRSEWSRAFGGQAGLNIGVQAGSNQMDNYKSASIEQIKADTAAVDLNWQYRLPNGILWESANRLMFSNRRFEYDVFAKEEAEFNDLRFDQLDFFSRQKLSFSTKKLNGYFLYEFQNLGRRYELTNSTMVPDREFERLREREQLKDFARNQTRLELVLNYLLSLKHRLQLTATNRYLRYDTPSEDNFDDHDELNYGLSIQLSSRWNKRFSTRYELLGNMRRYAFLFSERSQDNYMQPSLRMEFGYQWDISPKFNMSGAQFIYVTYNVKDFEDRNFTDRSTRNLETRLEFRYRPKPRLNLELNAYRKELHVSFLNWDEFTETTLDTTTTYVIEQITQLEVKNKWEKSRLFLDVGWRNRSQLRFLNTSMLSLENILVPINLHINNHQTGPTTGARVLFKQGGSIAFSLWWQAQIQNFNFFEVDNFTSLSANFEESELNKTNFIFRPFFKLNLNLVLR